MDGKIEVNNEDEKDLEIVEKLVEISEKEGDVSARDIERELEYRQATISRRLRSLSRYGIIERDGASTVNLWTLTEKGEKWLGKKRG